MDETMKVVKSDVCWLEIGMCRGKNGLEIVVKAEPRVEDIIKSMSIGGYDDLEAYGTEWVSVGKDPVKVTQISKDVPSTDYTINTIGHGFISDKFGKVNLSFLRFKGISGPEGVRFCVSGPVSRQHARDIGSKVVQAARMFVRDYVVPFNIGLRISSTEL